jgi:tryptophan-rich sensory protein
MTSIHQSEIDQQSPKSIGALVIGLAAWIGVCFLAAAVGSLATTSSVNGWFATINKPTWNPPNWIFGPVWTTLFLMMGVAAWLVWKKSGFKNAKFELGWFLFHLLLNVLWSVLFFGMQQMGMACIEIVVLWLSIAATIFLFHRHSKMAAGLLVPYLMWVSFATFLNYTIWRLN